MKQTINLSIPLGYKVLEKTEQMPLSQAEALLLTKRYRRYTRAVRCGDDAQLHAHYLACPHCGREYLLNTNSYMWLTNRTPSWQLPQPLPKAVVREWAAMQLSLFQEPGEDVLIISSPVEPPDNFHCPTCGWDSRASSRERQVILEQKGKKITVKCEIVGIDELLSLEWVRAQEIRIRFPVFEAVTFDLARGRVYVRVEDAGSAVLCQRDITSTPDMLKGGAAHKVFLSNKKALRHIKRLFKAVWQDALPYTGRQLDLVALFKMTMFVGYPRHFYDSIPYAQNSLRIDSGFRAIAKRMHFAHGLVQLYDRSGLPGAKSLRRILFSTPGLFFYMEQIKALWDAMEDPNLLSRFLVSPRAYEILSAIQMQPGILDYIRDYCLVKGACCLMTDFAEDWEYVLHQAIHYCSMSRRLRMQAQRGWSGRPRRRRDWTSLGYSLPMGKPDEKIPDCAINGFSFCWLRNSNEYATASDHLQNCLDQWRPSQPPVVGVRRKGQYVAAIEVSNGAVTQAYGFDNSDLDANPPLSEAVRKWMTRFHLQWGNEEMVEDPGPFQWFEPADVIF